MSNWKFPPFCHFNKKFKSYIRSSSSSTARLRCNLGIRASYDLRVNHKIICNERWKLWEACTSLFRLTTNSCYLQHFLFISIYFDYRMSIQNLNTFGKCATFSLICKRHVWDKMAEIYNKYKISHSVNFWKYGAVLFIVNVR